VRDLAIHREPSSPSSSICLLLPTSTAAFLTAQIDLNETQTIKYEIWDTAGQENILLHKRASEQASKQESE